MWGKAGSTFYVGFVRYTKDQKCVAYFDSRSVMCFWQSSVLLDSYKRRRPDGTRAARASRLPTFLEDPRGRAGRPQASAAVSARHGHDTTSLGASRLEAPRRGTWRAAPRRPRAGRVWLSATALSALCGRQESATQLRFHRSLSSHLSDSCFGQGSCMVYFIFESCTRKLNLLDDA